MWLENRQGSSGHSANRQQNHSWEPGPGHTVATEEHETFWKSQHSWGEGEGGQQKHSMAVTEICISGNTGGRQFEEHSNNKQSTKKRETQLKKQIKET